MIFSQEVYWYSLIIRTNSYALGNIIVCSSSLHYFKQVKAVVKFNNDEAVAIKESQSKVQNIFVKSVEKYL